MAVYDPELHRIVVRVVYDGPGFAGKTTNIMRLQEFFTTRRRGDLVVPEEVEGRTRYFDWMHLDGGLVQGYSLRCQLVTVPGQRMLVRRRWELLRSADVVVFVCDSTPGGIEEGVPMYRMMRAFMDARDQRVSIVVQANKQDLEAAVPPEDVGSALGIEASAPVLGARAAEGTGVRETVVVAIRSAANQVQEVLLQSGLDTLRGRAQSSDQLLQELRDAEAVTLPPFEQELIGATLRPPAVSPPDPAEPEATVDPPAADPPAADPPAADPPAEDDRPTSRPTAPPGSRPSPPLPDPDAPSGCIWPAATGRDVLRRVALAGTATLRDDLTGQQGTSDGSGTSDAVIYEAGLWCLKTSRRRRYDDLDEGRTALIHLARSKVSLGALLPMHSVLSLRVLDDGSCWLWTVCPWLTTLRSSLEWAHANGEERALGDALCAYASAAAAAIELATRRGVVLDVHPSNFGQLGDSVVYIDDDIVEGARVPSIGHALVQRVQEYASHPEAVERYVQRLETDLTERFSPEDLYAAGVEEALEVLPVRSSATDHVRQRLLRCVARRRAV